LFPPKQKVAIWLEEMLFGKALATRFTSAKFSLWQRLKSIKSRVATAKMNMIVKRKCKELADFLIVSDKKNCGIMNVTFDGVYIQK
jgi:hypothetical protein